MKKRMTALLLALMLILAVPLGAAAEAEKTDSTIYGGELLFGTVTLCGGDTYVDLGYVYADSVNISKQVAQKLSIMLEEVGFPGGEIPYNYENLNRQSFLMVTVSDSDGLIQLLKYEAQLDEITAQKITSSADVSGADVSSAADVSASDTAAEQSEYVAAEDEQSSSLFELSSGVAYFDVCGSLQESLAAAFPEFDFEEPRLMRLPDFDVDERVKIAEDGLSAEVTIAVEPEYTQLEICGEVITVLLISNEDYRYKVEIYTVDGTLSENNKLIISDTDVQEPAEEIPSESDVTATTSDSTVSESTVTTTATTTTAAPTTTSTTTAATTTATTTTTAVQPQTMNGYVNTRRLSLNMRKGPGFEYEVIKKLAKGTKFTVLSTDDEEWFKIRLSDGTEGYVYSYYVAFE